MQHVENAAGIVLKCALQQRVLNYAWISEVVSLTSGMVALLFLSVAKKAWLNCVTCRAFGLGVSFLSQYTTWATPCSLRASAAGHMSAQRKIIAEHSQLPRAFQASQSMPGLACGQHACWDWDNLISTEIGLLTVCCTRKAIKVDCINLLSIKDGCQILRFHRNVHACHACTCLWLHMATNTVMKESNNSVQSIAFGTSLLTVCGLEGKMHECSVPSFSDR